MLPKTHILLGAFFSVLLWAVFPSIAWYNVLLVFLASFLIDFDHYMCAVVDTKSFSLPNALGHYKEITKQEKAEAKRGIKRRGNFHVFHTLEFHLIVLALGLIFRPFLFVLLGMVFHSLLDIADMTYKQRIYRREFFLSNWINTKFCKTK